MGPISRAPALPERWRDPCFMRRCRQQVHDRGNRQVHGFRGRGLYQGPVFWRSRVAHIDQTGHVWHGKRPGLSTAVPFLVDGCWMQSVHVFMQYLIAQYSFNFFHIFYHRFISFHPFLILRKLDEVGAIGLWRRSHMNAQKIPKAVRQWKRLKKHVICFNVKHCKSVKPSKIKAY